MGAFELRMGCALLVVIVCMMVYVFIDTMSQIDASLYGFWSADSSFKDTAGIDNMLIYIGAPQSNMNNSIGFRGARCQVWIVIKSDGAVKLNKMVSAKARRISYLPNSTASYSIDHGEIMGDIIPQHVKYKHDPVTNMLVISDRHKMYGRLFKKAEPSFFCSAEPSLGGDEVNEDDDVD
jgi:hypothetical protein